MNFCFWWTIPFNETQPHWSTIKMELYHNGIFRVGARNGHPIPLAWLRKTRLYIASRNDLFLVLHSLFSARMSWWHLWVVTLKVSNWINNEINLTLKSTSIKTTAHNKQTLDLLIAYFNHWITLCSKTDRSCIIRVWHVSEISWIFCRVV